MKRDTRPERFFDEAEQARLRAAIEAAESASSAELRVYIESRLPKGGDDPYARARQVFAELGMHATRERNGVLVYLALRSKRFALVGDEELHRRVGDGFWRGLADALEREFAAGRFVEGLEATLREIGSRLAEHFPRRDDDENELSDELGFGE